MRTGARTKAAAKVTLPRPVPRKPAIARPARHPDIDDDAEERQRVGIQSLGRAFAILEEVARQRDGIALAERAPPSISAYPGEVGTGSPTRICAKKQAWTCPIST